MASWNSWSPDPMSLRNDTWSIEAALSGVRLCSFNEFMACGEFVGGLTCWEVRGTVLGWLDGGGL